MRAMILRRQLDGTLKQPHSLDRRFDLNIKETNLDQPIRVVFESRLERAYQVRGFDAIPTRVHRHRQRKNVLSENLIGNGIGRGAEHEFESSHRLLWIRLSES